MLQDGSKHYSQKFEQVIATVFTCRGVVKYNLALSEEQRCELLNDIDSALEVLRAQMIAPTPARHEESSESHLLSKKVSLAPLATKDKAADKQKSAGEQSLQALYRMYHAYLNTNRSANIHTFVTRFNDVMSMINDVQRQIEMRCGSYEYFTRQLDVEDPLQDVRVFIADLYYMFMEFVRELSDTLQQNNVQLDTEELSSMHGARTLPSTSLVSQQTEEHASFVSLSQAYKTHQSLETAKGKVSQRLVEGMAFLEFLKEEVGESMNKREEIVAQINKITTLLVEMARLLIDYERSASFLLYHSK